MNKKYYYIFIVLIILYLLNKKSKEGFQQISTRGMILRWKGAINNIPSGWVLCDGNNGTPDLRGRFVLGSNQNNYNIGNIGGEENHTITIEEMPSHSHKSAGQCYMSCRSGNWPRFMVESDREVEQGRPTTLSTGGSQPHNNMPPYYVLAYIMKI